MGDKPKIDGAGLVARGLELQRAKMPSGATLLDAACAWHEVMSASFETHWRETRNPIWVWRCIARLRALCSYAAAVVPELRGKRFIAGIPDWCQDYMIDGAYKVERLARLRDYRDEQLHPTGLHLVDGQLTPKQCAERLPAALGFVRSGWNAFREYEAEELPLMMLETAAIAKDGSYSFDTIMQAMGWEDERNARRKLGKLRRRAKPTL